MRTRMRWFAAALALVFAAGTTAHAIPTVPGITLESTCRFTTDAYYLDGEFTCTGASRGQISGASDYYDVSIRSPFVATCLVLCSVSISGYHYDWCAVYGGPPYEVITDGIATIRGLTAKWLDGTAPDEPAELTLPLSVYWYGGVAYATGGWQSYYAQNAELRFLNSGRTAHDWIGEFGSGLLVPLETSSLCLDPDWYYSYTTEYSMTLGFTGA